MRSLRLTSRRIPDWRIGCIDSKWRWILPWSICAAGLVVSIVVVTSLWNHEMLRTLSRYVTCEFSWKLTSENDQRDLESIVIWSDSKENIHVGGKIVYLHCIRSYRHRFDNGPPPPIIEPQKRFSDVPWREQLKSAIQSELAFHPHVSKMVIRVEPDLPLERIANICMAVRNLSDATLCLEVIPR